MRSAFVMCGRYALAIDQASFEDAFGVLPPADFAPRYNIAPTQPAPVVRSTDTIDRESSSLNWGFRHAEPGRSAPLINARSETAADRRSFAESFRQRRCLVPADGYYEWRRQCGIRQPVLFRPAERGAFAFAGLWQTGSRESARFTILTTAASDTVALVHDRMPVVLPPGLHDAWLDPSLEDPELVRDLLESIEPPSFDLTPLAPIVNNVANEGPECWTEAAEDPQSSLF